MSDPGTAETLVSTGGMEKSSLDVPEGYKQTELGAIPSEWQIAKIGELFDIQQGKSLSQRTNLGRNPKPFLRTSNVYWGRIDLSSLDVMDFEEAEEAKYALADGDLLVCEGGEVGRTAIWEGQLTGVYYQNHLHRLRARHDNVEPQFVMYWMMTAFTILGLYQGTSNKTTIPNLSRGRLASFAIPLPPLPEQREIARVLRAIQRDIDATQEVIAAARELRKSLMHHLFTYGPVPIDRADQVPLKETEIGPVPEHWQVVRLGEVVTLQRGIDLPKAKRCRGTIPVMGSSGLVGYHSEGIAKGPGVIVGRSGSVGKVSWIESDYWPLNTSLWVKDFHNNDRRFVYYLLSKIDFSTYAAGVSVPTLNRNVIHPILVGLPPLPEQREIARVLSVVDRKIEAEEGRKRALEELFRSMLHHLMTGKLRVRPDTAETQPGPSERQGLAKTSP